MNTSTADIGPFRERRSGGEARASLELLGRFSVRLNGVTVELAPVGQRVLALIALLGGADRSRLAGTLWPDRAESRALANLRGALWRIPRPIRSRLESGPSLIRLDHGWNVDVDVVADAARRIREDGVEAAAIDSQVFAHDLLPDWDTDWLLVARERHRQFRLHALEDLAAAQIDHGRPFDAVDTALRALTVEPLRESAQMLVLHAHLAAGNRAQVIAEFERFRQLLLTELDLAPSAAMWEIVQRARGGQEVT